MLKLLLPAILFGLTLVGRPAAGAEATSDDGWSVHGQTTFIAQGYPPIRSSYQGSNSLPGKGQGRETWTATVFVGRRLWQGAEIFFNPELAQGFGLASTLGLGGFSNGEAQKAGTTIPRIRAQRYFLRQTIGFGGEQERVEDSANQFAGKRDIDRITLTIGRFAIGDMFDANSYAHDPRVDFMNWAIWSSGAYDFPADLPGFTRGAVAELNRKSWALRAGFFQIPTQPNSDVLAFNSGGGIVEFEERHTAFGEPGKIRIGMFGNQGRTGSYREALAAALANPALDINDVMVSIRRNNPKIGLYINAEQAISRDAGMFARASWNDGKNEILSFADIDRSVSGGFSLKGRHWARPADTFGLAGAVNGLSGPHRDFLAAGGLGLLIGDGAINYRAERILESYYAIGLSSWATLTFDYQYVANPAYNADRGPVSIFAARLHAEF
jgi:high affinity Mn2+ porin